METLAVFEIEALEQNRTVVARARQALHRLDHEIVFVTSRPESRAQEIKAFLADRIKVSSYPKPAPTHCCGAAHPQETLARKLSVFRSLLGQHYTIERLICYEVDQLTINAYSDLLVGRSYPRSYSFYLVGSKTIECTASSAVYANNGPSEF